MTARPALARARVVDPFSHFRAVSPELLARRKLLRRTDTKFLVPARAVDSMLPDLAGDYGLLRAAGSAAASYRTLYFDTPDLRCFADHHRGRRPRHKVRIRHYTDRRLSFLEVKTKTNRNVTDKRRAQRPFESDLLTVADRAFVDQHCDVDSASLEPQLWTNFSRITLVGLETLERITIDTHLAFLRGDERRALRGVSIVEVKQAQFSARTPAMSALRALGCRPASASKYCVATALLRDVRANRFLPTLKKMVALDVQ